MTLTNPAHDLAARIGADRVLDPPGALPQPARRLTADGPVRAHELELAVDRLCLDSTSHRNLRERAGGDPRMMAARITEIVRRRGKMHNPETDSGGVPLGTVVAAGVAFPDPPPAGTRVVGLASLTLTPLRLDHVVRVDPDSAQVEVVGTAYLPATAPFGVLPEDLPLSTALAVYDVYGAASHTRDLTPSGDGVTVTVLGTGHAGKLALAAARDANPDATLVAVDVDPAAVERVRAAGLADVAVAADLRDPVAAVAAVGHRAQLTVNVVNATGCEPAAILLTEDRGTVLLYSMATSFQTSALTADGMSADVRMIVGNGFAPDRGRYALDLVRRTPALQELL